MCSCFGSDAFRQGGATLCCLLPPRTAAATRIFWDAFEATAIVRVWQCLAEFDKAGTFIHIFGNFERENIGHACNCNVWILYSLAKVLVRGGGDRST